MHTAQSPTMTPLQMLRAALAALHDPAAGLPRGMSLTHMSADQLLAAARAAAPTLLSPSTLMPLVSCCCFVGSEDLVQVLVALARSVSCCCLLPLSRH